MSQENIEVERNNNEVEIAVHNLVNRAISTGKVNVNLRRAHSQHYVENSYGENPGKIPTVFSYPDTEHRTYTYSPFGFYALEKIKTLLAETGINLNVDLDSASQMVFSQDIDLRDPSTSRQTLIVAIRDSRDRKKNLRVSANVQTLKDDKIELGWRRADITREKGLFRKEEIVENVFEQEIADKLLIKLNEILQDH